MYCDKCKKDIIENIEDSAPIYLICFNGILYWFCCPQCREQFANSITIDAYTDKGGHIIFKED